MKPLTAGLLVLLALLAYGQLALAHGGGDKVIKSVEVKDEVHGRLRVDILDAGEPIYQPYRMSISVKCEPKSKGDKTNWELITKEPICEFRPHAYDKKTKILELDFSTSEFSEGQAKCDSHWKQSFTLKDLCPR